MDYASLWRHATNLEQELLNSTTALERVRAESAQNRAVAAAQDAATLAAAEAANDGSGIDGRSREGTKKKASSMSPASSKLFQKKKPTITWQRAQIQRNEPHLDKLGHRKAR